MDAVKTNAKKVIPGLLAFGGLVILYYGIVSKNRVYNADEGYIVRAAYAVANGNFMLKGFIGGNVPQFAAISLSCLFGRFIGYGSANIYLVTAFQYALLVSVCCFLAGKAGTKRLSCIKRGFIVFAMIGLPAVDLDLVMHNSTHIACYALLFAVFYLVSESLELRHVRRNLLFTGILLTVACMDDSFALYFGVLPMAGVCLLRILSQKSEKRQRQIAGINLILVCVCVLVSQMLLLLVEVRGGLTLPFMYDRVFLLIENLFDNIAISIRDILYCFSGDFSERIILREGTVFKVLPNAVLAGFCVYCLMRMLKRFWSLSACTQLIVALALTGYVVVTFSNIVSLSAQRYYMSCFLALTVLLGRSDFAFLKGNKVLCGCFAMLLLCSFVSKMVPFGLKREPNMFEKVAQYLEENDLYHGYGEFWASHSVVAASDCRIQIGAVEAKVESPYAFLVDKVWYEMDDVRFFVFTEGNVHGITEETVSAVYGTDYKLTKIEDICIMEYEEDISPYLVNRYHLE